MSNHKLKDLLNSRRGEILALARQYGALNVRLFGSVARGDDDEASDIDLLVDMEPGRSLLDLGGFLTAVELKLGHRVDVVTEKGLRPNIHDRIVKEAVL